MNTSKKIQWLWVEYLNDFSFKFLSFKIFKSQAFHFYFDQTFNLFY